MSAVQDDEFADRDEAVLLSLVEDNPFHSSASPAATASRLTVRNLDTYAIRRVEWLDKPFLQRAAFTLLAGRKGTCKGTWICGLGARVSRGELYGQPKRVLVITSEDSVELDFLPRFVAAGGDPAMVTIVNGPFRMPADLPWLEDTARDLADVGLIVIDPVGNHLGGADTNQEGEVREGIKDLNPMADRLDCMIIGVRHLGKDSSRGALSSVLGSTAWVDVPRAVILMARDDEDDMLFHAQVVAGNRGPRNSGRAYKLELVDVPPATEITLATSAGVSTKNVEDLLGAAPGTTAPASRSGKASELILDLLEQDGEQESDALDARVSTQTGLSVKTIKNLRVKLSKEGLVAAVPDKDEYGTVIKWKVRRTLAPRPDTPDPHPDTTTTDSEIWLNQATSLPLPLESVRTGSGSPLPETTAPGPGRDQDTSNAADDDIDFTSYAAQSRHTPETETSQ